MAEQLVGMMTGEFDPKAYKDEYREALIAMIDAKAAGEEIAEPAAPVAKLTDLVAALEASVAAAKAARETGPEEIGAKAETVAAPKRTRKLAPVGVPVMAQGSEMEPDMEPVPVRRRKSA